MTQEDDLIAVVLKRLDDLISRDKERLIAVDASRHERVAGHIQGLTVARDEIKAEARKFRLLGDDDEDELVERILI